MTDSRSTEPVRDPSVDHKAALDGAASRLQSEFADAFGTDTIERFLHSSYEQFAAKASIPNFLPLLVERFTRQRLHALARVEDKVSNPKPTVLFLRTHNAGRSQMAPGYFTHLAGDRAVAWSGGSEPGNEINPAAIAAMGEVGIDITGEYPKPWTGEIVAAADVVITMGCGDACPIFPGKQYQNWELSDPAGQGLDAAELIVILGTQAHLDESTYNTPIEIWDTDEPSLRGIDDIEGMRLIRDDIATRVNDLINRRAVATKEQTV